MTNNKANRDKYFNPTQRKKVRKRIAQMGLPCAICGREIDYTLPAFHPLSFELDHIIPISKGGAYADLDNLQPVHRTCNRQKSNKILGNTKGIKKTASIGEIQFKKIKTSRDWAHR